MTYSEKELEQVEKLASLFMPISDIAIILGMDAETLRSHIKNRESGVSKAYTRGKVSSKLELRKQEMLLAKVGSPLAVENCRKSLLDMDDDE